MVVLVGFFLVGITIIMIIIIVIVIMVTIIVRKFCTCLVLSALEFPSPAQKFHQITAEDRLKTRKVKRLSKGFHWQKWEGKVHSE